MPSAAMFREWIQRGDYDESTLRRVGGIRETLTPVQRLKLATNPHVESGEIPAWEQQELIKELEKHLAEKTERQR